MPEYKFGEHHDEKLSENLPNQNQAGQTRQIPVHDGQISFDLGAKSATPLFGKLPDQPATPPPTESTKPKPQEPTPQKTPEPAPKKVRYHFSQPEKTSSHETPPVDPSHRPENVTLHPKTTTTKIINRIWHGMEFIAVTAAIFMVLFFIINYQSYGQLFLTKLDLLRGQVSQNPYSLQEQQALKNASPEGQTPLPIVSNPVAAKKQVPELTLEVAPPDDRVIIPRINQNVPVVQIPTDTLLRHDWSALEKQIQEALRNGVVHFPGTAYPGEQGNVVITGHSSYFPWDPGRFKDVFALLHQVNVGDLVIVYHDQKKYTYQVYDKKVVKPTEISVLTQSGDTRLTLITCTPVGTDLNRLVILAKPLSVT